MLDRIQRLHRAAQGRHEKTARRAEAALDALARSGDPVTVRGVAEAARVSRSWIYSPGCSGQLWLTSNGGQTWHAVTF